MQSSASLAATILDSNAYAAEVLKALISGIVGVVIGFLVKDPLDHWLNESSDSFRARKNMYAALAEILEYAQTFSSGLSYAISQANPEELDIRIGVLVRELMEEVSAHKYDKVAEEMRGFRAKYPGPLAAFERILSRVDLLQKANSSGNIGLETCLQFNIGVNEDFDSGYFDFAMLSRAIENRLKPSFERHLSKLVISIERAGYLETFAQSFLKSGTRILDDNDITIKTIEKEEGQIDESLKKTDEIIAKNREFLDRHKDGLSHSTPDQPALVKTRKESSPS